jgi:hypothetical protein
MKTYTIYVVHNDSFSSPHETVNADGYFITDSGDLTFFDWKNKNKVPSTTYATGTWNKVNVSFDD